MSKINQLTIRTDDTDRIKINAVKEFFSLETNSNTVRFCINEIFKKVSKKNNGE